MVLYTLSMLSNNNGVRGCECVRCVSLASKRHTTSGQLTLVCVGVCVYIDKLVVNNRPRVCFYLFSCSPQVCALDSIRSVPAAVLTNFGRAVGLRTTLVDP